MLSDAVNAQDLEEVYELNRLFLNFLKTQIENRGDVMGLPPEAICILQRSEPAALERIAEFPRALFRVGFSAVGAADDPPLVKAGRIDAPGRQALQLTIFHSLRNACRQSAYRARAFFGLSLRDIHCLRTMTLFDLPNFALDSELGCAFENRPWLWEALLNADDTASRRRLFLVAFQPARAEVPASTESVVRLRYDSR